MEPVPENDQSAWELFKFRKNHVPTHPQPQPEVFHHLYRLLVTHYPCRSAFAEGEVGKCVWVDSPLIEKFGHDMALLRIVPEHVDEVLPFIVEKATRLKLIVFEEAAGMIYRDGDL